MYAHASAFQSLLHQGISLLGTAGALATGQGVSFQSLLHQGISLLPTGHFVLTSAYSFGFNPFFIRASVYWQEGRHAQGDNCGVSIPSSSGHQFTAMRERAAELDSALVSIPSSSGHQFTEHPALLVIERHRQGFNPFFIRASVY